jgi:hypothetical protein
MRPIPFISFAHFFPQRRKKKMSKLHIGEREKKVVAVEPLHLQNLEFHGSEKKNVGNEPSCL